MPIVTIQIVGTEAGYEDSLQALADALGELFGSEPQGTWVRMEYLPIARYAENQGQLGAMQPTTVEVLKGRLPDEESLAEESRKVARCVAQHLERPLENCHVIYQPEGAGRVAFGGELVRSD